MSEFSVRRATVADFQELAAIDQSIWADRSVPDGEHAWRVWVEFCLVFCATSKESIIGSALAFPTTTSNLYFLHKIFVLREWRQSGVGKQLMAKLCHSLDELKVDCSLTTSPKNEKMIALSKHFGFSESQLRTRYYGTGKDRLFLTRRSPDKAPG
ncbi:MAG: GNAT family N-acetyltransferase [Thiohalocapsa sp. PB-PSB1]|jgi:ribosomal protein S18 acetylase RimI-like enzyme|nr:MAG: hypothetical protein N838_29085 [Thiohalocapsa sp. PB-PSB1]QQO52016.1 MAG: GNAT family N-acetyltransferase [Thiohalocapsa sp. PB-PSB1]HCS88957.1 N-acetyltransferase [Chromatiaceae bacterium]